MQRFIGAVVGLTIFGIVKFATTDSDDVYSFNEKVVPIGGEMSLAFEPPLLALEDYGAGNRIDVASLRQSLDASIARLDELNAELAGLSVPDDEVCRAFHASVIQYGNHWKLGSNSFKAAADYVEAHNPPPPDAREYIGALLDDFWIEEDRLFSEVGARQDAMAAQFDMEVIVEE